MNNRFHDEADDKIKDALMKNTDSSLELKEEIWNRIEKRINEEKVEEKPKVIEEPKLMKESKPIEEPKYSRRNKEIAKNEDAESSQKILNSRKGRMNMRTEKRNQKGRKNMFGLGTVAAALIIFFLAGTAPGHAAIERIKEFFVPEKPIVEEIEGMKEEKNVQLQESKLGYVIYFDETMYQREDLGNKDRIVPIQQGAILPEIYMEIHQVVDKDIETLAAEIEGELKAEYPTVNNHGKVEEPVAGILLYAQKGNEWNDEVVRYYIVDNTDGGSFVIKQQFFLEAAEGHGVRFDNILKEFQIIELQK